MSQATILVRLWLRDDWPGAGGFELWLGAVQGQLEALQAVEKAEVVEWERLLEAGERIEDEP